MPKLTTRRLYGIGVVVFVAALPLKTGGCGNTACITVTSTDLAQANGACPSPDTASQRIGQSCGGPTVTVTGDGELDGALCCYPVDTQSSEDAPCPLQGGVAGVGGAIFNGSVVGSTGSGCGGDCSVGFDAGCVSCLGVLEQGASPSQFCSLVSEAAFMNLAACACKGPCGSLCSATLCIGNLAADVACAQCVENGAMSGCATPAATCAAN